MKKEGLNKIWKKGRGCNQSIGVNINSVHHNVAKFTKSISVLQVKLTDAVKLVEISKKGK